MSEVSIEIKSLAGRDDLQRWEDHMLVKAKCWNQYCDGLYSENEIGAVHVVREDKAGFTYLTTLCEDCIKYTRSFEKDKDDFDGTNCAAMSLNQQGDAPSEETESGDQTQKSFEYR